MSHLRLNQWMFQYFQDKALPRALALSSDLFPSSAENALGGSNYGEERGSDAAMPREGREGDDARALRLAASGANRRRRAG